MKDHGNKPGRLDSVVKGCCGRYVTVISRDILVNCMELRWRQPCSDSVAPCWWKFLSGWKTGGKKEKVSSGEPLVQGLTHTNSRFRRKCEGGTLYRKRQYWRCEKTNSHLKSLRKTDKANKTKAD